MELGNLEEGKLYYMTFTGISMSVLADLLGYDGPVLDHSNNYLCFEWEPYPDFDQKGWDLSFMPGPELEDEPGLSQAYFQSVDNSVPIHSYEELVQMIRGEEEVYI